MVCEVGYRSTAATDLIAPVLVAAVVRSSLASVVTIQAAGAPKIILSVATDPALGLAVPVAPKPRYSQPVLF